MENMPLFSRMDAMRNPMTHDNDHYLMVIILVARNEGKMIVIYNKPATLICLCKIYAIIFGPGRIQGELFLLNA